MYIKIFLVFSSVQFERSAMSARETRRKKASRIGWIALQTILGCFWNHSRMYEADKYSFVKQKAAIAPATASALRKWCSKAKRVENTLHKTIHASKWNEDERERGKKLQKKKKLALERNKTNGTNENLEQMECKKDAAHIHTESKNINS